MDNDLRLEVVDLPRLVGSPYYGFAVQAHAALLDSGAVDPSDVLVHPEDGAIVAQIEVGGTKYMAGIVVYSVGPSSLSIGLAYVQPDLRRRGIYRHMLEAVVKIAERLGDARVTARVGISNAEFGRAAVATGMRVASQVYEMWVGPEAS